MSDDEDNSLDYYMSDDEPQPDGDEPQPDDNEPQSDDDDDEHKAQFSEGDKPKNRCTNVKKRRKAVCTNVKKRRNEPLNEYSKVSDLRKAAASRGIKYISRMSKKKVCEALGIENSGEGKYILKNINTGEEQKFK